MKWLDSIIEGSSRSLARRSSRRGFLGALGTVLVGAAALPLLPVARGAERAAPKPAGTAGDPGDRDVYGAQQHARLFGIEI